MRYLAIALILATPLEAAELVGPPEPRPKVRADFSVARETRNDFAWMLGAAALDLGTTELALSRCGACYEANPLLRDRGARVGLKLGVTAGVGLLCRHLRRTGRHKEATISRWVVVGSWVALSVVNLTNSR